MMKKDKLITIRVNEQIRDKFNQWCNEQGLSASEFLYNIIEDCVSGNYEMSSNNKERSNKIARQRLIALEAKLEKMSSQIASVIQRSQEEAISLVSALQQPQPNFDITDKVKVLEKQIADVSCQGENISKLIDDKLDKNDLDGLVESKIHSIFDVDSLYKTLDNKLDTEQVEVLVESKIDSLFNFNELSGKLDNKLDTEQVEVLVESKIDSLFNFNELSEKLDSKLDKDELEALVKSQLESILMESNLVKQIENKLYNTIDKQEVQTLVKSLVDSSLLNQDSLLKVIEKMIDDKLINQVYLPLEVADEVSIDNLGDISSRANQEVTSNNPDDISSTGNEEESIDNPDDISSTGNDEAIIEKTDNQSENAEEVSPEKEVSLEVESEESIAEAIDNVQERKEKIPLAFQELPLGKLKVTALAQSLGIAHSKLGRIAEAIEKQKEPNLDFFPQLWDYVRLDLVKDENDKGKTRRVWSKIK
ncbi:MAG: hypothetical protein GW856_15220 [Cyanobacteria bacterium]|nr:hypothetical protein [Cyanobacteria bacterium CG_2015-16_32_12]NCO77475.1 hypothetical protein [Cyanobacteria bacterium CG_2015-22_32_23]NCQ03646.1 hypothetical protein [Cyanobacteria bacterium CG_2015-09_32_10]NCS84078.1 hypothetical protein [Cyanobacteria bacterium CG_2015-02_32_10]